jgi:hypothetical protein
MKAFRTLSVWQKARQLTVSIYRATKTFPREELYGLTSQLRRGSASVSSNIAEGCGRGSDADFGLTADRVPFEERSSRSSVKIRCLKQEPRAVLEKARRRWNANARHIAFDCAEETRAVSVASALIRRCLATEARTPTADIRRSAQKAGRTIRIRRAGREGALADGIAA